MMVSDISDARLIILFVDGLTNPLHGWVRAYNPTTLQDVVTRTRDIYDVVLKYKLPPTPTIP